MTPTLAIVTPAFVLFLLSAPGTAAGRRRIKGGGSSCVNDQNQRVLCVSSIIGAVIGGIGSSPNTAHIIILTTIFLQLSLLSFSASVWLSGAAAAAACNVWRSCPQPPLPKTTQRRALWLRAQLSLTWRTQ